MKTPAPAFYAYPNCYKTILPTHTITTSHFQTHTSKYAQKMHCFAELLFLPAKWNAQLLGRSIQPLPGAHKNHPLLGLVIRITCATLFIFTLPLSAASIVIALPLRALAHRYRPAMSYINNATSPNTKGKKKEDLLLTESSPLRIRTHNVGFVPTSVSTIGNLRRPTVRAQELVDSIIHDPLKPDLIFFQETFNEDATKILCEGIKDEYPYIIHNVAPHLFGLNSGSMVASKYPIEHSEFHRFNNMIGPERLSPRGLIKVRIQSQKGPIVAYGVHTQAVIGESRAQIRAQQIEYTKKIMDEDKQKEPNIIQVLVGDFNTCTITPWGESTVHPKGHSEEQAYNKISQYFQDVYLKDHDPLTGKRTQGTPFYLNTDNQRFKESLQEPSGSWYHGLLSHPGSLYSLKMKLERTLYGKPTPLQTRHVSSEPNLWGTPKWYQEQAANTARFDYILIPKQSPLTGFVEIRRPIIKKGTQSAPSDHLPVDARIFLP